VGVRAFVALDLDGAARERLIAAMDALKPQLPGV
jgi:hypothetical protein